MRQQLASESSPRPCYRHLDRAAEFARIEERSKPVPHTCRIPACRECADQKQRKDDGLLSSHLVRL